jgi:GT2 family glycosyltransferase
MVVDDGSTDATSEVSRQFPSVRWTRWASNRGLIAARNHMMMNGPESDYFVSLDDDAWFIRGDEIATAIQLLERRLQVAAVAFDILSPDRPATRPREEPRPAAMFPGCGHVVRLKAARSVGLYETVPGSYGGEEKDLCLRLIDAGYEIVSLPGVHVWHDKTLLARDIPAQHRSGVCNDLVMTLRRSPVLILPVALVSKLFRHFLVSWRHGLVGPFFEGCGLFVRSFPAVWRSRMPVRMATLRTFMRLSRAEITPPN